MSTGEGELPRFKDPDAAYERFGFRDSLSSSGRLPGMGLEAGNMFDSHSFVPNCNMEDGLYDDKVWGMGRDGRLSLAEEHPVLTEIFYNNAIRRLQAVEQLTLPPEYTTIPNTAAFSRFEHIWGSVLFVRKMAEQEGMAEDEVVKYQLRTLLSDVAHTTGSHIGDWLFQGVGEAEDVHDNELEDYLEVVGITDILGRHGIDPKEVIFPPVSDWVEAKSPDLCVDRVDYGLREMNRWNDAVYLHGFTEKDFTITPDNMLAMTDLQRARVFAEGYLLLSQEHWSEPTHRFIEEMFMLQTKLFYAEGRAPNEWVMNPPGQQQALVPLHEIHPRDLMYVTDPTQLRALGQHNLAGITLDSIMRIISQYRRQYVWPGRRERIGQYMSQFVNNDAYLEVVRSGTYEPLESQEFSTYLSEYPLYLPTGFTILDPVEAAESSHDAAIDFTQVPFKVRQIDPLVKSGNGFKRLSELDESYAKRLAEHRALMSQTHVARLAIPDSTTRQMMESMIDNVEHHWQERLASTRRMAAFELRALVDHSSSQIFGRYPFMSFLDY